MLTFQDFEKEVATGKGSDFVLKLIQEHRLSSLYSIAVSADAYDRQLNETINNYVRTMFTMTGTPVEDFTASNNKLASNFFHRLNTQRCAYSLGNGVSFTRREERTLEDGSKETIDITKEKLGTRFDTDLKNLAYYALIHGVSFGFWNMDRLYVFPFTEFAPLWDEYDGTLKAGVRFWRLDPEKPLMAVLYEQDGYTKYRGASSSDDSLSVVEEKRPYKIITSSIPADHDEAVIGVENYSSLPIIPLWGSRLKQSTLVGMKEKIDSFDLIRSGFANDLSDCSQIYWIIENCGGMSDEDLARVRDRLKINHIVSADTDAGGKITPYTQDVPYQARKEYLEEIRAGIYEDFGALDVHTIAAGATNDHIDAAYQPMDENADDFEYQIIEFIQQVLRLMGIDDTPIFKRNRISNQKEQTEMVMSVSEYLDEETILSKLPFISVDEVQEIIKRRDEEAQERMPIQFPTNPDEDTPPEEDEEV